MMLMDLLYLQLGDRLSTVASTAPDMESWPQVPTVLHPTDTHTVVCGQAIATGTLYITLVTILARTEPIMGTGTNGNDTG